VQCTRTITPSWLITELLPFVTFPCPEHYLKTSSWNSIQLHTIVKHIKRNWSAQEQLHHFDKLQSYCPLILFLVWSITCKVLVWIQNNFIQWSSTIRGSSVHKNHNSIQINYRVISLLLFYCPEHNLKTTSWKSIQFHTMVKYIERKCSAQKP
jgi:hypothetical protein